MVSGSFYHSPLFMLLALLITGFVDYFCNEITYIVEHVKNIGIVTEQVNDAESQSGNFSPIRGICF